MTDANIYFQWQNPALLKTIYPRREAKLRHVLEFYYEIDTWAEYKNKTLEELSKEITEYHAYKKKAAQQIWDKYDNLLSNYFIVNIDDPKDKDLKELAGVIVDKIKGDKGLAKNILDKLSDTPSPKTINEIIVSGDLPKTILNKIKALYKPYIEKEILHKLQVAYEDKVPMYASLPVDERRLAKIISIHTGFQDYFKDYTDVRSESVFISTRLNDLDNELKILNQDIYAQSMRLEGTRNEYLAAPSVGTAKEREQKEDEQEKRLAVLKKTLDMLQNTQRLMAKERTILSEFLTEHGKLAPRKKEWEANLKEKSIVESNLAPKKEQINRQAGKLKEIQDYLIRIQVPPDFEKIKQYFSVSQSIYDVIEKFLPIDNLKNTILDVLRPNSMNLDFKNFIEEKIVDYRKEIIPLIINFADRDHGDQNVKRIMLKPALDTYSSKLQDLKERVASSELWFKEMYLMIVEMELDQLNNLRVAVERSVLGEADLKKVIKDKETEKVQVQKFLDELKENMAKLQAEVDAFDVTEENYLQQYIPIELEVDGWRKEIVLWKVEKYKEDLLVKDQYQLLEEIIDRFTKEPDRYPLWLQYMIIHFSGMRYKSAHGSWADPKDLYLRLKASKDTKIKKDLAGLFDLVGNVEAVTEDQLLAGFEGIKDVLPRWVWKEIYAITKLRLKYAEEPENPNDATWERFTPDEQKERNPSSPYFKVIVDWKNAWFTEWRDEHWRNKQMITSRAVCNEVAEYIQHLRGHKGGAGLASKPDWYRSEEDAYQTEYINKGMKFPDGQEPVFLYPRELDDYRVGASILWLRYKNSPAHDWDKVKPFTTSGGDQMIPAEYLRRKGSDGAWVYKDSGIYRTRTPLEKGKAVKKEYGFWLHEQTVAGVEETAEGRVLLTFETALPYDDPSVSAIGLTKHYEADVLVDYGEDSFNRFFVGFVPEKELPGKDLDDLKEMLNWNHILRDPAFMIEEKLKEYQEKYIRINAPTPIEITLEDKYKTVSAEPFTGVPITPGSKFYVKIWGDYGDDKDLAHLAGRDVNVIGTTNFQAVPLYTKKGGFNAVSQYIELDAAAMDYLKSLQIEKGLAFKQTMNWLISLKPEGENPIRPYWTKGGTWEGKWSAFIFGTIVFGGQMVQVEVDENDNPKQYQIDKEQYPSGAARERITFYKLIGLRRADIGKVTHLSHPWLIHRGTAAGKNNAYDRTPRGLTIYSPVWDPQDWNLTPKGKELFIAAEFLQKNDPANEIIVKVNDQYVDRIVVDMLGAEEKKAMALKEEASVKSAALKTETEIKTAALKKEAEIKTAALKKEAEIKSAVLKKETDVNSLSPAGTAEIKSAAQKRADEINAAAKEREAAINDAVQVRAETVRRAALKREADIAAVIKETEEQMKSNVKKNEKVMALLKGKEPKKYIMALRNLLNLVVDIE